MIKCCDWDRIVGDIVKMPSPGKRKLSPVNASKGGSSTGNVSVPIGGQKNEEEKEGVRKKRRVSRQHAYLESWEDNDEDADVVAFDTPLARRKTVRKPPAKRHSNSSEENKEDDMNEDEDEDGEEEEDEDEDADEDKGEEEEYKYEDEDDDDDYNPVAGIDDNDNDTDDILDGSYNVEVEEVVIDKIRKRRGGEGGREKTQSIEKSDEKKGDSKVEQTTEHIEVLLNRGTVATVQDLFTGERKNITVDGIGYSSGVPIVTTRNKRIIEYKKVYRCLMVMNIKNKKEGWRNMASHRNSSNKDYVGCQGRMEGFFLKNRYWFRMTHCHTCDKGGGSLDNRPRIQMISPAPSWNITRKSLLSMRKVLEGCPKNYWENLTHQGASRQWLKEIVEPKNDLGVSVKRRIEEMMKPYLEMVRYQNPHLMHFRVGALRTQPKANSQYKNSGSQLHADYPETVKMRDPGKRPVSIIMALDEPFNFLYEDKDNNDNDEDVDEDDICELVVNKGHAIAFTDELFHAGGENSTNRENYRLFAYVVSDERDYPNNMVFTKNKANMDKLNAARKKRG